MNVTPRILVAGVVAAALLHRGRRRRARCAQSKKAPPPPGRVGHARHGSRRARRPTAPTSTAPRSSATASCRRCSTSCPGRSRSPATSRGRPLGQRARRGARAARSRSLPPPGRYDAQAQSRRRRARPRRATPPSDRLRLQRDLDRFTRRSPHGHLQHCHQVLPGLRPVHLPERADHGARHHDLDRALHLPQQGAQPEPQGLGAGAADAAEGPVPRRAERRPRSPTPRSARSSATA